MKKSYQLIYDDQDIIVLDKAGHVLTIPDRFDQSKKNLKSMMDNRFGSIYVVHRLDFETSGVIIFARNEAAHQNLSEQFYNQKITKEYLAITVAPEEEQGIISAPIEEIDSKRGSYKTGRRGKESTTEFEVIERFGKYALLKLTPYTGRTHQIRVHLKHNKTPLVTDKKYGKSNEFYLSQLKKVRLRKHENERPLLKRSSLHSYQLSFQHPSDNRALTFSAPLHKDMKAVIYQLQKSTKTTFFNL